MHRIELPQRNSEKVSKRQQLPYVFMYIFSIMCVGQTDALPEGDFPRQKASCPARRRPSGGKTAAAEKQSAYAHGGRRVCVDTNKMGR